MTMSLCIAVVGVVTLKSDNMTGVHELTLRTADGRERRTLVWFPSEAVHQDYYEKALKRGLEIANIKSLT